jgi:hypothetical protein
VVSSDKSTVSQVAEKFLSFTKSEFCYHIHKSLSLNPVVILVTRPWRHTLANKLKRVPVHLVA